MRIIRFPARNTVIIDRTPANLETHMATRIQAVTLGRYWELPDIEWGGNSRVAQGKWGRSLAAKARRASARSALAGKSP
ncbi:hypothetical protein [Glutamicibacter ardleyensis]|uniref:hypothetical protein n=1 Tax=Glutamicibacter ardleyensis TaxID=225894 RepID=UPI003FD0992E